MRHFQQSGRKAQETGEVCKNGIHIFPMRLFLRVSQ